MHDNNDIPEIVINTDIDGARAEDMFRITDRVLTEINRIREEKDVPGTYGIRIGIRGQSCSGMQFGLGFDDEINDTDKVIEVNDANLLIDRNSLFYLQGITLDFLTDINGSGFVFQNPYDEGCGGCSTQH